MKTKARRGLAVPVIDGKEPWLNRLELAIVAGFLLAVGGVAADQRLLFVIGITLSIAIVACKIVRRALCMKGE